MNFKKYQKYLLGIASVFLLTTKFAYAQLFEWTTGGLLSVVGYVIGAVLYIIGVVASWGVIVGGTLVNWSIDLNSRILTDSLVKTGWVVSRDIANLGFVFFIILIAFATILQLQNYSMKKLLWKLVAAAILVNFSLVIAGVFIDLSGIMTEFFLSRATGGNLNLIGEGFTNAMAVHRVFQVTENESVIKEKAAGISDNFNNFVNFIASLAFAVFFTVAAATALFSFAAMFFIRYLSLITLLILAPIAWLMLVWPETANQWNKWWSVFFKWIWFGPAASFFFYLALSLALTFNKGGADFLQGESLASIKDSGLLIQNLGKLIAQMTSVIGLMYYGLTVANSMGVAGANFGFAVAGKVKGAITGAAGLGIGAGIGAAGLGYGAGNKIFGAAVRDRLQRWSAAATGVPVLGGLAQNANIALSERGRKSVDEYRKHYSSMDREARFNAAQNPLLVDSDERAAIMSVIAEKDGMEEFRKEFQKDEARTDAIGNTVTEKVWKDSGAQNKFESLASTVVNKGGPEAKQVLSSDPTLAQYIKRDAGASDAQHAEKIAKEIAKAIGSATTDAIKNIKIDTLIKPENIISLRNHHLNAILERSSDDIRKFVEKISDILEGSEFKDKEFSQLGNEQKKIVTLALKINANHAWSGTQIPENLLEKFSNKKKGEGKKPRESPAREFHQK